MKFKECIVCNSPFVTYVRDVLTRRTKKNIPLYYCMECESFFNPSGYQEDDNQLSKDLDWNISVKERNIGYSRRLIYKLLELKPNAKSLLEIGCGIGTFLSAASDCFPQVIGYDTNHHATEYGKRVFNLDLRNELWTAKKAENYDIIACISVLEHLEHPRPLFEQLALAAKQSRGILYISVPFLDRDKWNFILDPDPYQKGTPFFDNDVHVTHFSRKGLLELAKQCGANKFTEITQGWVGYVLEFN
ncbi:class I SAM-dependent methyltransferase [Microcoleus sp. K1-B6]|uniref:class I SAM-dependent methyltransferase n=1 Tax=unclassified Microcoleus TaxID=2642155 RepID=UPI002FD1DE39